MGCLDEIFGSEAVTPDQYRHPAKDIAAVIGVTINRGRYRCLRERAGEFLRGSSRPIPTALRKPVRWPETSGRTGKRAAQRRAYVQSVTALH